MSACNILNRILLPKKDPAIAEVTFVPGGSPVPSQYQIPLLKKVPMFPAPTGCLELFTSKLGHQAYINKKRHGFDLTDPYNYNIDCSYNCIQDPHMLHVIRTPAMKKKLKELGQITNDERVRCTVKQFNNFRAYLKGKALIDFHNQLEEEKLRAPKIEAGDSLEVVAIEHRVHEQEVRFRRQKTEEETFTKYKSLLTQSETKMNIRKRKRQELNGVLAGKRASNEKHRQDVYRQSLKIARQLALSKLKGWKKNAKKHINRLHEVESSRINEMEEKLQQKWSARRENQLVYEELVEASRASEKDRREKSLHVLGLEMNRRWQLQANKLQMLKDVSRQIQAQREEAYARNLINAFAKSRILNPQKKPPQKLRGSTAPDSQKSDTTEDKSTKALDADMALIPKFKTIFFEPVKKSLWVLEKELKNMGLTSRLHAVLGSRASEKELALRKREMDTALAAYSGTTIDAFVPKKKKGKSKSKKLYPTSVELMEGERASLKTGEEICVLKKREDIVNDTKEETIDLQEFEESDSDVTKEEEIQSVEQSAMSGFIGLQGEDLEMMEGLLTRLMENVQDGKLNQEDLMQLTIFCSSLQGMNNLEQTTSTTSLMAQEIVAHSMALLREDIIMRNLSPHDLLAAAANIKACRSEISSVSSDRLELLLNETMGRTATNIDVDEDDYNEYFLEQMLRSTVANLTVDIERGTLSRTNVHEIGSALAQAVMDDMDSDDSLMAEDTLMTILQQLQQDIDLGQIDDKLLDKALASLVSSYGQVLRGQSNIDFIRDFVLYVLLRTRQDLEEENLDKESFIKELQCAKIEAGVYGMDLPDLPELVEVTSKAIGKLKGLGKPDQAIVALIKMILGPGRRIMPAIAKSRVQWISQSMIEQAEESQVQLQIILDLTASVCTSFTHQMNEDMYFARDAERILGPRFLVMLFSYWGQLDMDKEKETKGVQTLTEELTQVTCVRGTLAENVVLVCFNWLWQDAMGNRLPVCIMPHVALDTAEFPSTRPLLDRIRNIGDYMEKMSLVDEMVLKKVRKVAQELQEGGLGHEEAKALLTICLHAYLREVVFCDPSEEIVEDGSEPPGMVSNVQFLITTCARSVLEFIQNKVARRMSALGHAAVELSFVTEILMETASDSVGTLTNFVTNNSEAAEDELIQLDPLIKTSQWDSPRNDPMCSKREMHTFLKKIINMVRRSSGVIPKNALEHKSAKHQQNVKAIKDLIRRELLQIAKEVSCLFSGLVSLHNLLPPKPSFASEALFKFIVSLLLELRRAVTENTLPLDSAYDFVKQIAEKKCPIEAKHSPEKLVEVIMKMVKDIELKNSRSDYYLRIVNKLSKMSLEKKDSEEVAAGMAAIAHLLSNVDQSVLTTFLQSTLLSMLRNIRALRQVDEAYSSSPVKEMPKEGSWEEMTKEGSSEEMPKEGSSEEMPKEGSSEEEDILPNFDLIPETKIVVHVALQKTMERLGAATVPPDYSLQSSQTIVQDLVSKIQVPPDEQQRSTDTPMDTSLAAYAQGLASEISRNLQDEASAGSSISNKSIANVIISNTLKSINSGIKSGKIHLSFKQPESEEPATPESLNQRLSFCVSATLKAVKSELNLINLTESSAGDDKGLSEEESREAIEKARRIVDYLIKRVGSDIEDARVEFQLTSDNQLSVIHLSPSSSQSSKKRLDDSSNNFWNGPLSVIAQCVHNTFQDVLLELKKHNEFFDPKVAHESTGGRNSSLLPGLPYLVEDFILKHLLEVARILPEASRKAPRKLKKENLLVARALYDVIQHKFQMDESPPATSPKDDSVVQEMTRRQKIIYEILANELGNAVPSKYLTSSLSAIDIAEKVGVGKTSGTLEEVIRVMQEILTSKQQNQEEELPTPNTQPYPAPGDAPGLADVVVQTAQQTALYVREGQVEDHDLGRLCAAFDNEVSEEVPTEVKQQKALESLDQLVVDLRQGKIPRKMLQQAAQQLKKEAASCSDSQALSTSTQELLKQAVSGLMEELTDRSKAVSGLMEELTDRSQEASGLMEEFIDISPHEEDTEERDRRSSLRSRKESLEERTVSKTDVRDPSENRMEKQTSRLYSTTQQFPTITQIAPLKEESENLMDDTMESEGTENEASTFSELSESKITEFSGMRPRFSYLPHSAPMDIPNFIHIDSDSQASWNADSQSSLKDLIGGAITSTQSDTEIVQGTKASEETAKEWKSLPNSLFPEQTGKGGRNVTSISGLLDTVSSSDMEPHLPSEATATESQMVDEPSETDEKTGKGGLQVAPISDLLDTTSAPVDRKHHKLSKVSTTDSEPDLYDIQVASPDTEYMPEDLLPTQKDKGALRTDSIRGLLDTVSTPIDSGRLDISSLPTDTVSESGSMDLLDKAKGSNDSVETEWEGGLPINTVHSTSEPPDTGFQTDSQRAKAPTETVLEDDTNNSVSTNLPDDEKQEESTRDWNRSAVTSSRTNHLARIDNLSRSSTSSLVGHNIKTTGSHELQKSPSRKYKKKKRRSAKRDSSSKQSLLCEELLSPINKWKKLLDKVLPITNGEGSNELGSPGSRRNCRTDNPKTKHQKRSVSQNEASSLSIKTTVDTPDEQPRPFYLDDVRKAASDPSPTQGTVEAQKRRTYLRIPHNRSAGKLPNVTESTSMPREDHIPHGDIGDESSASYFAHASRCRLNKTLDGATNRSMPLDHCLSSPHHVKTGNLKMPQVKKKISHKSKSRNDVHSDSTSSLFLSTVTALPVPPEQQPKDPYVQSLTPSCHQSAHKLKKTAQKFPVHEMTVVSQSNFVKKEPQVPTAVCSKIMSKADIEVWLLEEQRKREWKGRRLQKEAQPTCQMLRRASCSREWRRLPSCVPPSCIDEDVSRCEVSSQQQQQQHQQQQQQQKLHQEQYQQQKTTQLVKDKPAPRDTEQYGRSITYRFSRQPAICVSTFKPQPPPLAKFSSPEVEKTLDDGVHQQPTSRVRLLGITRGKHRQTGCWPMVRTKVLESTYNCSSSLK